MIKRLMVINFKVSLGKTVTESDNGNKSLYKSLMKGIMEVPSIYHYFITFD